MTEGLNYGVTLEDRMSGPANVASKSIADLSRELTSGKKSLATYQSQLNLAKNVGDIEGYRKYSALLGETRSKVFATGEALAALPKTAIPATDALTVFGVEAAAITGGLAALAAGVLAVGGAIGFLAIKGAELAIHATEGKLAMISMFAALGGGEVVGRETEEMLSGLSDKIGITKDELAPLTKSFMAMGIEGTEALEKVTLAAASAQAIMGDPKAAQSFEALTKKIQVAVQTGQGLKVPAKGLGSLADMGVRVDEVAKRMNVSSKALADQLKNGSVNAKDFGDALQSALIDKGAGPLQKLGNSFGSLKKMMSQSIDDLFEDMEGSIGPFMAELKNMFSIFSQSTNSGKAMKDAIGGAFKYVFAYATMVIPYIHKGFLKLILYSLTAAVFVKKHWKEISSVLTVVGYAVAGLGALMVGIPALLIAPFVAGGIAVAALVAGLIWLGTEFADLMDTAAAAGVGLVEGFVDGIKGGISKISDAASEMGQAAVSGLKKFLLMSSPSKLMFQLGGYTAEPFAGGMQAHVGTVQDAGVDLGAAASTGVNAGFKASDIEPGGMSGLRSADFKLPGAESSQSGAGGGVTVNGGIKLEITAPGGVTHALELTEVAIATLFERLALQQGL